MSLLSLSRVDYLQVGTTSRKSMCLLPVTKKERTNRIVVGDHWGDVSIFAVHEGILQSVAKTRSDTKITRVELGAPENHVRDRIFYAAGTEVRGLTKKGKEFLRFNTNLCEEIRSMCVMGVDLFVCGNYTCLQYSDLKNEKFAALTEKIHDVVCLSRTEHRDVRWVVACDDRSIQVMKDASLLFSVEAVGTAQVLKSFDGCGVQDGDQVLYGTVDGKLGLVCLDDASRKHLWEQMNDSRVGAVTSIDCFDVAGDGVSQLILGREDGLVEIHAFTEDGKPEKRFSSRLGESVTTVCGGFVARPEYAEVVCCTYAGWVSALTTQPLNITRSLGETTGTPIDASVRKKLEGLKTELLELQTRMAAEKEKKEKPRKTSCKALVSIAAPFSVNDTFRLDPNDATYLLTIEVPTGIEYALLHSDVSMDIAESDYNSRAIISFTRSSDVPLLATFRCHTTRLDIRLSMTEGLHGTLRVYVSPRRVYPKAARLLQYEIKPLSLHQRTNTFDDKRPLNFLQITGNYSLVELHSWLSVCLPGLPDRTPADDKVVYSFVSTLLNTVVECTGVRGQTSIRSDNLSTIMTLSDVITKEATKKKISLSIRCTIDENSIPHTLRLIHPMLLQQLDLAKKVQLVEALMGLTADDKDASYLSESDRVLLKDADRLVEEHRKASPHVARLHVAIVNLFVDSCRFRGRNVKSRINALQMMLSSSSYSLQDVEEFFANACVD